MLAIHCTAGHEGSVGDLSYMSIFSACFGLPTSVQLAATTCTCQIWISGWILPHFDVRTISVAWKLKKLSNIFWQKIFFLLHPLSKGVAPLCTGVSGRVHVRWPVLVWRCVCCPAHHCGHYITPAAPLPGDQLSPRPHWRIVPAQWSECSDYSWFLHPTN